ncbi:MAG TPA: class I SAM-dependent methyltransferase [Gaiellaceae bacterium]|nr:class I SAM-dependent methyltransferase [Gaiellaceae bacterium]
MRRVRDVIERLMREGTVRARQDGSLHTVFPVAASPAEGEALRAWIVREGATRTIEIGLGYGVSALFACEGLLENDAANAQHVAIDPHQATRFADCGLQLLEDAGVAERVEHQAEDSQTALPRLLAEGRRFDLAFVDGNHRFDYVFVDLVYVGRLLRPGGIAFLDDYQLPGVARAAAFFVRNLGWTLEEVSPADEHHQWAVLRTPRLPDTRPYDHYVDF